MPKNLVTFIVFAFLLTSVCNAQNPASAQPQPQSQPSAAGKDGSSPPAPAQVPQASGKPEKVLPGSRVFLSPMQGNLEGFISAEIIKQKLPLSITTDENSADYVLTGTSIKADDRWYHVVFGGKDKNEGNVTLISTKQKTVVWAGEAGDRSMWWGGFKRGGERKVADRIVSRMKKDLF
jgi:hypothetical protein